MGTTGSKHLRAHNTESALRLALAKQNAEDAPRIEDMLKAIKA